MSVDTPLVSIIIPCKNEVKHIEDCLNSVLAQKIHGWELEIIVADGMSDDGTREILKRFQEQDNRVRLVDNPISFVGPGLNAALRVARGAIIVRMDAHTKYAEDYIEQCVLVQKLTEADNVGGPWIAQGTGYISRAIAAAFNSVFAIGGGRSHRKNYEGVVDTVYLGCWPIETFKRYGEFDEAFVRNQDDEHNLRITRGGGKVWQSPRIKSIYTPRSSLRNLFKQYFEYGYWKTLIMRKYRLPASLRHLAPPVFILFISLGWLGFMLNPWIGYAYLGVLALYFMSCFIFAILAGWKAGWDIVIILPITFIIYHISYGVGFIAGLIDIYIFNKFGRISMKGISRD